MQVFTHAQRGCIIHRCQNKTPDRKWNQAMWVTSHNGSMSWDLRKVRVEFLPLKKKVDFQSLPRPCGGCRAWWGVGRWKSQQTKIVYHSPYVKKPFNSKVIKSFVPELRSHKCFCVLGFLCYLCMSYEHSMYISHIYVWLCNIYSSAKLKK